MTDPAAAPRYDAVVLAGGSARRLGGIDKPARELGGRSLLDRVLDAVREAERVVVVGPVRSTVRSVLWTREEPPGAGPVPALAAGLAAVRAPLVVVLAADLPFLAADVVRQLLAAVCTAPTVPGAVVVDDAGASQWLLGCWRTGPLRAALPEPPDPVPSPSLRAVMAPLAPLRVRVDADGGPPAWYDCDTSEDLAAAQAWLGGRG